ncbi:MAG: phospholipase [Ruminococcaceae bacterium]|nr:phospholipase [Oscillospiraceae bacterium]
MYEKLYFENPNGKSFHYLRYVPKDVNGKMPLVVYMHGAGERGNADGSEIDIIAKHGFFEHIKKFDSEFPFLMVAPQCPSDEYWGSYIESLNKFLDYVIENNDVDTDRIYLTGLSMGGTATWLWALDNPDRFAAIAPVCGQGINWYAHKLADLPVHAYHGDIDSIVSVHESVEMVSSINRKGGNAVLTLYHGVKHNAWDYAYDQKMIDWLLQHKLSDRKKDTQ